MIPVSTPRCSVTRGLAGSPKEVTAILEFPIRTAEATAGTGRGHALLPIRFYRSVGTTRGDDMRYIALIMLVLVLAACGSSSSASTSDPYSGGNTQTCTAYAAGESDTAVVNDSQGIANPLNPDYAPNPADPRLQKRVATWASDQDRFSATQSDPSQQNSAQATADQRAMTTADNAVDDWCSAHGS